MSDTSRSPTLSEVLREVFGSFMDDVHVAMPCRVESYDAATQCVNLQPVIKQAYLDEEGERVAARLPVLVNCPVQFPGGGKFRVTFPITAGDTGMAIFSESSLDVWLKEGGEVDPLDDRRFHLSDAVFLPGIRSRKNALAEAPTDRMTLGADAGVQVHIDEDHINLGSNNPAELQFVALSEKVDAGFESLREAILTHIHPTAVGPTALTTLLLPALDSTAGSVAKAKV